MSEMRGPRLEKAMERRFTEDEQTMKRKQNSRESKEGRDKGQSKRAIIFTEQEEGVAAACSNDLGGSVNSKRGRPGESEEAGA